MELTKNDQVNLLVELETLIESCENELHYIKEFGYDNEDYSKDHQNALEKAIKLHHRLSKKFKS